MQNVSRKPLPSRFVTILKGTMIASICAVVICGAMAFIILKGKIPTKTAPWIPTSILLISSYFGGKYTHKVSDENSFLSSMLTGIIFILLLVIINVSLPNNTMENKLPKIISVLTGTALTSLEFRRKSRGRTTKRRRHDC